MPRFYLSLLGPVTLALLASSCASITYHKVDPATPERETVRILRGGARPVRLISIDDLKLAPDFSEVIAMAPGDHTITFAGLSPADDLTVTLKRRFTAGQYVLLCPGLNRSKFQERDAKPDLRWAPFIRGFDMTSVSHQLRIMDPELCQFAYKRDVEGTLPEK